MAEAQPVSIPFSITIGPAAASFACVLGILQVAPPLDPPLSAALSEFAVALPVLLASAAFQAIADSKDLESLFSTARTRKYVFAFVGFVALVGQLAFLRGLRDIFEHFDEDTASEFFALAIVLGLTVLASVAGAEIYGERVNRNVGRPVDAGEEDRAGEG